MANKGFRTTGFVLILAGIIMLFTTLSNISGFSILESIDSFVGSFMVAVLFLGGIIFLWLGNKNDE